MTESQICLQFVKELRFLEQCNRFSFEGKPIVWFHVRNEFAGKVNPSYGLKKKMEGVKAGVADYVFIWEKGHCFIEFKAKAAAISSSQSEFADLCQSAGVYWTVARSVEEGMRVLEHFGLFSAPIIV